MKITPIWDHQLEDTLNQIKESQMQLSIFHDKKGDLKAIHTELNDGMFALLLAAFHRNIEVHGVLKRALINIEKFKDGEL